MKTSNLVALDNVSGELAKSLGYAVLMLSNPNQADTTLAGLANELPTLQGQRPLRVGGSPEMGLVKNENAIPKTVNLGPGRHDLISTAEPVVRDNTPTSLLDIPHGPRSHKKSLAGTHATDHPKDATRNQRRKPRGSSNGADGQEKTKDKLEPVDHGRPLSTTKEMELSKNPKNELYTKHNSHEPNQIRKKRSMTHEHNKRRSLTDTRTNTSNRRNRKTSGELDKQTHNTREGPIHDHANTLMSKTRSTTPTMQSTTVAIQPSALILGTVIVPNELEGEPSTEGTLPKLNTGLQEVAAAVTRVGAPAIADINGET